MIVLISDPWGPKRTSWKGERIYLDVKGGEGRARKAVLDYLAAQDRAAAWVEIQPHNQGDVDWTAKVPREGPRPKQTKQTKEKPCDPT